VEAAAVAELTSPERATGGQMAMSAGDGQSSGGCWALQVGERW